MFYRASKYSESKFESKDLPSTRRMRWYVDAQCNNFLFITNYFKKTEGVWKSETVREVSQI
jgi:hypothetical protein